MVIGVTRKYTSTTMQMQYLLIAASISLVLASPPLSRSEGQNRSTAEENVTDVLLQTADEDSWEMQDDIRTYDFLMISDQDKHSVLVPGLFYSTMTSAKLHYNTTDNTADFILGPSWNYTSFLNMNGRGMELSDLKIYQDRLITVDDKTGIIYWLTKDSIIPWLIISDGNGTKPALFKGEWLTTRGQFLFCGSTGRENTDSLGAYVNDDPMFVKRISGDGAMWTEDWTSKYITLRAAIQVHFPGYMIHESAQWSEIHKRWFFLPRHVSKIAHNQDTVHEMGANVLLSTSDCFCDIIHVKIGEQTHDRGFSSFQFVPGTEDTLILAIKTYEQRDEPLRSSVMLFDIEGKIHMEEKIIPGNFKYEGLEFYNFDL